MPVSWIDLVLMSRLAVANEAIYEKTRKNFHDTENLEILKIEILLAHDESEAVEALIFMNFVRWREFHCRAAPHVLFHIIRRVVTPKSHTGGKQQSRRRPPDPMMRFACSLSDCWHIKP